MQGITLHSTTNYKYLKLYLQVTDYYKGEAVFKSDNPNAEPVKIEYLWYRDMWGDPIYRIEALGRPGRCHSRITFSVNHETKTIRPLAIKRDSRYYNYTECYYSRHVYKPQVLKETDEYLWDWLLTMDAQGFQPVV